MENNEKQKTNKTKMDRKKKEKDKGTHNATINTTRGGSIAYTRFNVYSIDIIILKK